MAKCFISIVRAISTKLKEKFYRKTIKQVMFYRSRYYTVKNEKIQKMTWLSKMLKSGNSFKDQKKIKRYGERVG